LPRAANRSPTAVSWKKELEESSPYPLCRSKEKQLIPRYTRQEMGHVWSDANKFAKWLKSCRSGSQRAASESPDRSHSHGEGDDIVFYAGFI